MNAVKVEPAVIEAAIKEYTAILGDLEKARDKGVVLTQMQGPGRDMPSQVYANAANTAGKMHQQANTNLQKAIQARIDLLKVTLDQYRESDKL